MKNHIASKHIAPPQISIVAGKRVFKFPYRRLPAVTGEMWERMKTSARIPHKGRRYPVIAETPDT